jgi:molybdopterin biosynthesis enzyme MoaB
MNNVVKGCTKPYVTYSYSLPGAHKKSAEYAVIRTYSADFAELNALTERANALIPPEGLIITVPGDRGLIKLSRGTPFNEAVPDADYLMKARKINYFITCYAD